MRQPSITCQDNGARRLWGAPIPLAGTRLLVWMSDVAVVWVCVVHCVLGVDIMWLCVRSYGRFLFTPPHVPRFPPSVSSAYIYLSATAHLDTGHASPSEEAW